MFDCIPADLAGLTDHLAESAPRFNFFALNGAAGDLAAGTLGFCLIVGLVGWPAVLNWGINYICGARTGSEQRLLLKKKCFRT
jgi:hypothetical protein